VTDLSTGGKVSTLSKRYNDFKSLHEEVGFYNFAKTLVEEKIR
jgi:hypothetical protein